MIKFVVGAAFGVILGVVWLFLPKIVSLRSFCYMLTLAIVLLAYALSESFGGSGAFSSLLFGLVLGNEKEILKQLKWKETDILVVDPGLKRFESEVAFLIRTSFFVFLDTITAISNISLLFLGVALTALLLPMRLSADWLATTRSDLKKERSFMSFVLPRGWRGIADTVWTVVL